MEPTQNRLCRQRCRVKLFDKSKNILSIVWANFKEGKFLPLKSKVLQECCWMPWKQLQQCKNIYWGSNSCFSEAKHRTCFSIYIKSSIGESPSIKETMRLDTISRCLKMSLIQSPKFLWLKLQMLHLKVLNTFVAAQDSSLNTYFKTSRKMCDSFNLNLLLRQWARDVLVWQWP